MEKHKKHQKPGKTRKMSTVGSKMPPSVMNVYTTPENGSLRRVKKYVRASSLKSWSWMGWWGYAKRKELSWANIAIMVITVGAG